MGDKYVRRSDWQDDDAEATVYLSRHVRIRLTDPRRNPLPHAKCRLVSDKATIYECDEAGVASIPVTDANSGSVELEWEPRDAEQKGDRARFPWRATIRIDVSSIDDQVCRQRLTHLGFRGDTLEKQVAAYQRHLDREPTGRLDDIRRELAEWHDGGNHPERDQGPAPSTVDDGSAGSDTTTEEETTEEETDTEETP